MDYKESIKLTVRGGNLCHDIDPILKRKKEMLHFP